MHAKNFLVLTMVEAVFPRYRRSRRGARSKKMPFENGRQLTSDGRPIVYDITHLRHRLAFAAPTGIDRVDLIFARHFAKPGRAEACARYGRWGPRVTASSELVALTQKAEIRWRDSTPVEADTRYRNTVNWIMGDSAVPRPLTSGRGQPTRQTRMQPWNEIKTALDRYYPEGQNRRLLPQGAVYLNIAQHALEHPVFFKWLGTRNDVRAVFFVHDILPLDFPEYWPAGHRELFSRRVDTIFRYASALITSTAVVRERILREMDARNVARTPIHCAHLPSPTETVQSPSSIDAALKKHPYFVILGTMEPRKNHTLLLNAWRRLAARGEPVPKLVIIGNRGWENENAVDMLDRSPSIADHVWEVSGLSNAGVNKLLANARALLMPSFAEGYGLPLVEALGVGTPVIASDIPVFREVTQGRAIFCDPIDGIGWSDAVTALANPESDQARAAQDEARRFLPVKSERYFEMLHSFLLTL